jgi:NADH dehydrogenase
LWRTVYLFKLPSWSRRTKVGFDWAWEFIFSRDLSHLKTDHTTSVTRAYYQPGDYIFRQGDLGRGFYIIEKGQVEVLRSEGEEEPAAPVAMLKEGDFFGEMALIESQPRSASVRAHTPVEVVVMGQNVFSQLSRSLTPLRHILIDTIKRRKTEDDHRLAVALGLSIPLDDIGEIVALGLSIRPPRKSEDIDPTPPPKDDLES